MTVSRETHTRLPPAPRHLSPAARRLFRSVVSGYELEQRHVAVLVAACEAMDRMYEARAAIDHEGIVVEGRYGPRAHPALALERDSRIAMMRGLRELGLDLVPEPPRLPTKWRSR